MYKNNFVAVIKCDGHILREQGGTVYLPFGKEYSVLLKNKDARRALVEVEVDGENVLSGHKLVMNGNETQEVIGFMRDMKKSNRFKFIKKTRDIQKYRGDRLDDGLVRITYQFEKPPVLNLVFPYPYTRTFGPDTHNDWTTSSHSGRNKSFSYSCNYNTTLRSSAPAVDEGITVKGNQVSQNYQYGNIGLLDPETHTIILHLKGARATTKKLIKQPLTVKSKLKCETCGKRNRSTNKFCFNCGTYLE
jgi:ribosomal protein L32